MLTQKDIEAGNPGPGEALRLFMANRAIGGEHLGGRLALVQIFLRIGRPRKKQH